MLFYSCVYEYICLLFNKVIATFLPFSSKCDATCKWDYIQYFGMYFWVRNGDKAILLSSATRCPFIYGKYDWAGISKNRTQEIIGIALVSAASFPHMALLLFWLLD